MDFSQLGARIFGGAPAMPAGQGAQPQFMSPGSQAWSQAAAALLRAKDTPGASFAGALGNALQAGMQGYQGALLSDAQRQLLQSRSGAYDTQAAKYAAALAQQQAQQATIQRILHGGQSTPAAGVGSISQPTVTGVQTAPAAMPVTLQGVDIDSTQQPPLNPAQTTISSARPQVAMQPTVAQNDPGRFMDLANQFYAAGLPDYGQKYLEAAIKQRPELTTLMQNAQAAGYTPGTPEFQQFIRDQLAKSGQTVNVNTGDSGPQVGTIPQGFALYQREDGGYEMRAIPGGPADIKAQQAEQKAQARHEQQTRYGDVVLQDASRALELVDSGVIPVTGVGSYLSVVRGTRAHDLSKMLDSIKSNISFDRLQQLREASPTGGALGQVSDFENRALQSAYGSLEQSQTDEQFKFNLKRLMNIYADIIHGPGHQPYPDLGQPDQPKGPIISQAPEPQSTPQPTGGGIKFLGFD